MRGRIDIVTSTIELDHIGEPGIGRSLGGGFRFFSCTNVFISLSGFIDRLSTTFINWRRDRFGRLRSLVGRFFGRSNRRRNCGRSNDRHRSRVEQSRQTRSLDLGFQFFDRGFRHRVSSRLGGRSRL